MRAEEFALAVMDQQGVSVTRDEDQLILTCEHHEDDQIDTHAVHKLAAEHDLPIVGSTADFDAGEVRLYIDTEEGQ